MGLFPGSSIDGAIRRHIAVWGDEHPRISLEKLVEECGEVVHAAQRYKLRGLASGDPQLRSHLELELIDLLVCVEFVLRDLQLSPSIILARIELAAELLEAKLEPHERDGTRPLP